MADGPWPELARQAAVNLTARVQETNPMVSLLLDLFVLFANTQLDRLFSHTIVDVLNASPERPWAELRHGKPITVLWLSQQLRPYGIRPGNLRLDGIQSKGYLLEDFQEIFRRYLPPSEVKALLREHQAQEHREEKIPKNTLPTPHDSPPTH